MKYLFAIILITALMHAYAQENLSVTGDPLPIPTVNFDAAGALTIKPSATSSARDFDFLTGTWKLKHRKLKSRFTQSNDWEEFETVVTAFPILTGIGNMDIGHGTVDGKPWEGRTIRVFDSKTRLWRLHWMASNAVAMAPPVTGSFENGVGHFFGKDVYRGREIIVVYRWDARDKEHPRWSQAFSADNGRTWEWNWYNVKERMTDVPLKTVAQNNNAIPIPGVRFDSKGDLLITAAPASSAKDFDFLVGKWKLKHRKLMSRLSNSSEWEEFETIVEDFNFLEGAGNMDVCHATFDGAAWEGRTIRLFNPQTRLWSLHWVASNVGVMDPPVIGSFENGIGHFFGKDTFNGKPIIFMFRWDARDKERPVWSQAFSADNGKTWEWNWYNVSYRIE
ncbi:MAG TPA: hypothetical protein VD816_08495 [Ohtaekwangia sp.]|nr:hypothetical protein [Ohtaekwangia sp.]